MRLSPATMIFAAAIAALCLGGGAALGLAAPAYADGGDSSDGQGDEDGTSPDDPSDGDDSGGDDSNGDTDDNLYGCPENTWTLCLQKGRFHVQIDWFTENDDAADDDVSTGSDDDDATNPNDGDDDGDDDDPVTNPNDGDDDDDSRGMAQVVYTTSDKSGLFYFFDPANWEVLVKVLDGCAYNDYFWVYAAAATDVGYEINVYDQATGSPPAKKVYDKPAGPPAPALVDVAAFPCEAGVPE